MDYAKQLKSLTLEMKKGAQFKRIPFPFNIPAIIAVIPFILGFVLAKIGFVLFIYLYKMVASPADYLHQWLKNQKDEVEHATQAVMYFVCLPTIFGMQVILAFFSFVMFIQWLIMMINAYLLTLGGIRWQPFINDIDCAEDTAEYEYKPSGMAASIFACIAAGALVLGILFNLIPVAALDAVATAFYIIYAVVMYIVNPLLFKRIAK